jgi:2-dehydro-3-deoxyphosphogluconate aldolase/(4S)-4-hydroxy-2-oxoglutarate aldolase
MEREQQLIQHITNGGLMPLFYHDEVAVCEAVVKALYAGGIRTIEFTNRGPQALVNFKSIVALKQSMPDLMLGIGTIKTADDALLFIEAGADFLVSPIFDHGVADVAYMHKILWIPGCMTPTEIHVAQQAGCKLVKLFPGNVLGPGYIDAIKPLFSGIQYLVTGGVDATEENIGAWFKSGAAGVGLGSKLITKNILDSKNFGQLTVEAEKLIDIMKKLKN